MHDKVALVTGGGAGIGRASCLRFARAGAKVVVADRDLHAAEQVAEAIRREGGTATAVAVDVSIVDQVDRMVDTALQVYGQLDCAHNHAGIPGQQASLVNCTLENWHTVLDVNLTGTFLCLKAELRVMLPRKRGSIVNTSSTSGLLGFQCMAPYVATKHGIIGLTRAAALEVARSGIRVNAVCPSGTMTPMLERLTTGAPDVARNWGALHPVGRLCTPEEVAESVVWLCSDAASFITGHALPVDGGIVIQ